MPTEQWKILLPHEIKMPKVRVRIERGGTEKDWHGEQKRLGGTTSREVLCADRNYVPFITEYELQRNGIFDSWDCVTQGGWNGYQTIGKKRFNVTLNKSKRWTAIKGGTKPQQGASIQTVLECIREMGGVPEEAWPSMSPTMTEKEFYQAIPAEVDAKEDFKADYETNHEWLPTRNYFVEYAMPEVVWDFLQYSPILACVNGEYHFNKLGELTYSWEDGQEPTSVGAGDVKLWRYTHVVLVVGGVFGKYHLVLDSENPSGLMKVEWNYKFGSCKALYLKKKIQFQLVKTASLPAVYLYWTKFDRYLALADKHFVINGKNVTLAGGDILKTFSGDYKNAKISIVDNIPQEKIISNI